MLDQNAILPKPFGRAKTFNALNDGLFKFVFGKEERKAILIDFLNTFLEKELEHPIKDITFLPTEKSPKRYKGKSSRYDLACELDTGAKVEIEVQLIDQKNMERRSLAYWAQIYLDKLDSGQGYKKLVPVYMLNILNYTMLENPKPFATCGVCDLETYQRLFKDLSISFLELPKFTKIHQDRSKMTKMERWMCYFSDQLSTEDKEAIVLEDEAIMTAISAARHYFDNPEERRAYINEEFRRMDEISVIEGNRREERETLVCHFLEKLPDLSKAAELLGLDLKEVRRIAEKFGLLK